MPIENNFKNNDLELILTDITEVDAFPENSYIRLSVHSQNGSVIRIGNPTGNLIESNFVEGDLAIFYHQLSSSDEGSPLIIPSKNGIERTLDYPQDLQNYLPSSGQSTFIKINELLSDAGISSGNYSIRIEILKQFQLFTTVDTLEPFILKEISPSRKEVRLKLRYNDIGPESVVFDALENELGGNNYSYKHILTTVDGGENVPILNYVFDNITDGELDQSIILRLYNPVPSNVSLRDILTIEREVVSSQTQDIYYISDEEPTIDDGSLPTDPNVNEYGTSDDEIDGSITYESYNDLSASSNVSTLNSLVSGSIQDYPNLNINFNEFSNHTFFGSAVKKLKNFKTKIKRIEEHYNDISMSLSASSGTVVLEGDASGSVQDRTILFEKIDKEIDGFTPYERFLYFDAQSQSTSSAPGIGKNYTHTHALNINPQDTGDSDSQNLISVFSKRDGFRDVYKISVDTDVGSQTDRIYPFTNTEYYRVENKPFFGYSGSIYLSFLIKGNENFDGDGSDNYLILDDNDYNKHSYNVPIKAVTGSFISQPDITGSWWQRYVLKQSCSYWTPNSDFTTEAADITEWNSRSTTQIHILSGSIKSSSYAITTGGDYQNLSTIVTASGNQHSGSITPIAPLFPVHWLRGSTDNLDAYFTDVKITLNDPTDIPPFAQLPRTSSTEWTSWYDGILDSASAFDSSNIHSMENNLPLYIQESNEYEDVKKFLSMTGEQYDLIRNHIDGYLTLYRRGYKDNNDLTSSIDRGIVPDNVLPILGESLGWEFITPFTGSLADYFKTNLDGVTDVNTIRNNTWRKSLNNLLYLYKSKGTRNSVNALLNIYGYPSDVLEIEEYGGSTHNRTPGTSKSRDPFEPDSTIALFSNDGENDLKEGLFRLKNITSFVKNKKKLYHYRFVPKSIGKVDRQFELDWKYNNVNADTLEFIYKHNSTKNTQELFINSGSANQTLWDLRLVTSGTGASGSFEFRLSTANTGSNISNDIGKSSVSMSTNYISMSSGDVWNVMLQRLTSSISGSGVQTYQLVAGLQEDDKLKQFSAVSMSVSGGLTNNYVTGGAVMSSSIHGLAYFANQNWLSTGSRHIDSSSNLYVGKNISSSIAQIRTWEEPLKITKFKQHVFDKFSIVGNTISSSTDSLIYNFKLNENYRSGSISGSKTELDIIDANPKGPKSNPTNYSFTVTGSIVTTGSTLYGYDIINTYTQTPKHDGLQKESNKIYLRPKKRVVGNLSPNRSAVVPIDEGKGVRESIKTSNKLTLDVSPADTLDKFIIENVSNIDLSQYYGKPSTRYSSSYEDLDKFKRDFFNHHNVEVDINKFVRAYENVFNQSIYSAVGKIVPARSNLNNPSVVIKPTLLERQRIKNHKLSTQSGSQPTDTIDYKSFISLEDSSYEDAKTGSFSLYSETKESGNYESSSKMNIDVNSYLINSYSIEHPKSSSINIFEDSFYYNTIESGSGASASISFYSSESLELSSSANPNQFDDKTVIITSTDGRQITYTLKSDETFDVSNTPTVGIQGETTIGGIATRLSQSIAHPNGHGGRIKIITYTGLSVGNVADDEFLTNDNELFNVTDSGGRLILVQRKIGLDGNKLIRGTLTSFASSSIVGFGGANIVPFQKVETTRKKSISTDFSLNIPKSSSLDGMSNISESGHILYPKSSSLNFQSHISESFSIKTPTTASINYSVSQSSKIKLPNTASLSVLPSITSSKGKVYNNSGSVADILYHNFVSKSANVETINTSSIKIVSEVKFTSSLFTPVSSKIIYSNTGSRGIIKTGSDADEYNINGYKTFRNIHQEWGTGDDDLHFFGSATSSKDGSRNTGHIDDRFIFTLVGDTEVMSGSFVNSAGVHHMDFSNHIYFHNRQIVDKDKKISSAGGSDFVKYNSLFGNTFTVPPSGEVSGGIVHGRMMGKTRFFTTRSNGEIIYPSNHVTRFADNYGSSMWKGTQNINPGVFPKLKNEDYSSASFYRVNVQPTDGDNQIIVKTGDNKIDLNNNIVR